MSIEERTYEILVCPECGELVDRDRDCPNFHLVTPIPVKLAVEWDSDPTKYGIGRHALLVKPAAHLVPPPGHH